jgi:hypothetical protein
VIVDISQHNVSFDSTSLVFIVPACNKAASSSRIFFMAKVTEHAGKSDMSRYFIDKEQKTHLDTYED